MKILFIYDESFLPFLFPNHRVVQHPGEICSKPTIFISKNNRLPGGFGDNLIVKVPFVMQVCDFKLVGKISILKFISEVREVKLTKSIEAHVFKMPDRDFLSFVKMSIAAGKWIKAEGDEIKIYNLFQSLLESKEKFLVDYFRALKDNSFQEVWSSVLTFLTRLDMFDSQKESLSEFYRTLIFNAKKNLVDYKRKLFGMLKLKKVSQIHILDVLVDL